MDIHAFGMARSRHQITMKKVHWHGDD